MGKSPQSIAIGDFNHDQNWDFAVANTGSSSISVFLGFGDGGFEDGGLYPLATGTGPDSLVSGHFRGSQFDDLAIALGGVSKNLVTFLFWQGDAGFTDGGTYGVDNQPTAVAEGDFNGDGQADVAFINSSGGSQPLTYVEVLSNSGDGGFVDGGRFDMGIYGYGIIALEPDGGPSELAVCSLATDTEDGGFGLHLLASTANGAFIDAGFYATGADPAGGATADFNEDGAPDLAIINHNSKSVTLLLSTSAGQFAYGETVGVGYSPSSAAAADFNGDGHMDLAVANYSGSPSISILIGFGDGGLTSSEEILQPKLDAGFVSAQAVGAADFNGDGVSDLLVADYTDNTVSLFLSACK